MTDEQSYRRETELTGSPTARWHYGHPATEMAMAEPEPELTPAERAQGLRERRAIAVFLVAFWAAVIAWLIVA